MTDTTATSLFDHGDVYEAIYRGRGKDYAAESARIVDLVTEYRPGATSLLDVACGPASHLVHLAPHFDRAEGIDLSQDMLRVARTRAPGLRFHQGDMRAFDTGTTYDVVLCLFSSIAYATRTDELDATLRCMARHLNPGGLLVVEPWWFPEDFLDGHVGADVITVDGRTIARISHSTSDAGATRMDVHYVIADPEDGIRHFSDTHRMTLFERADYEAAIERSGLMGHYLPAEKAGPGLFVAVRPARASAA
ncbi:class I SAM-dependent methyltransferase [Streptomyces sp. NPDC006235]|uniref:class I SAM-dependent methyltransferase n=1 Tax=Streptomyces sp. NPDC006235 TaxID=3156736 RepID=UPI0033AD4D27